MRILISHDFTCPAFIPTPAVVDPILPKCICGADEGLTPLREYLHAKRDDFEAPEVQELRAKLTKWGGQSSQMRLTITESQRMALCSLIAEYLRKPDHTEVFINCSAGPPVETTPESLLDLFLNEVQAPTTEREVPDELDVWVAHDLLDGILRGETGPVKFAKGVQTDRARVARDVLCWFLGHKNGDEFVGNIEKMKAALKEAGIEMFKKRGTDGTKLAVQDGRRPH